MPSFSLTDTRYVDIRNADILAMGASVFPEQTPLPAVPKELYLITNHLGSGTSFLNESFTLDNLKQARDRQPFDEEKRTVVPDVAWNVSTIRCVLTAIAIAIE
jgi:CHAT domain-containing protein